MNLADFQQLCRDTCIALNHPDSNTLFLTNQITIDGITIGLFFDDFDMNDRLVCYVDIGELPITDREEILERMLAINLLTGSKVSGVYGLDRRRDCIIFTQHFLYPDLLTGVELAEIFKNYATHAKGVQQTLMNPIRTESIEELLEDSLKTNPVALV